MMQLHIDEFFHSILKGLDRKKVQCQKKII